MCLCGHEATRHWYDNGVTPAGQCDIANCGCRKYRPNAAQASKSVNLAGRLRKWAMWLHVQDGKAEIQDALYQGADEIELLTADRDRHVQEKADLARELRLAIGARDYANDMLDHERADAARYRFLAVDADRATQLLDDTYKDWNTDEPWNTWIDNAIDRASSPESGGHS